VFSSTNTILNIESSEFSLTSSILNYEPIPVLFVTESESNFPNVDELFVLFDSYIILSSI